MIVMDMSQYWSLWGGHERLGGGWCGAVGKSVMLYYRQTKKVLNDACIHNRYDTI